MNKFADDVDVAMDYIKVSKKKKPKKKPKVNYALGRAIAKLRAK